MKISSESTQATKQSGVRLARGERYRYTRPLWHGVMAWIDVIGNVLFEIGGWLAKGVDRCARRLGCQSARSIETPVISRILVIQLDHLGDGILSLEMLRSLRQAYPAAQLDILASRTNAELFIALQAADRVWVSTANRFSRHGRRAWWPLALLYWAWKLRRQRYDLAIDVRGELPHAALMWLAGAKARVGWAAGGGGFCLTASATYVPGRHEVDSRVALLRAAGVPPRGASAAGAASFGVASNCRREQDRLSDRIIILHLGAGTTAKRWPVAAWQALVPLILAESDARVVLVGVDPFEIAAAAAIVDLFEGEPRVTNRTGPLSIAALVQLYETADLAIGADSGPAHLAATMGVATLVLFSGTNRAEQWRPRGAQVVVLRHDVPCAPCHQHDCPFADHPCMRNIDPRSVWEAARRLLPDLVQPTGGTVA